MDARRKLLPLPIARVRNCLADYRRELEELGAERVLTIATSAVRDAENGEAFLGEIEWSYGFTTRLLSGEEEASLVFAGRRASEPRRRDAGRRHRRRLDRADPGDDAGIRFRVSIDLGSVRLSERFLATDPPTETELADCAAAVRSQLAERVPDVRAARAIGVAGTITSLAALDLGLVEYDAERVHGHELTAHAVGRTARTAGRPATGRAPPGAGLEPERAPVIVGGAVLLRELLEHAGLERSRRASATFSTAPRSRRRSYRRPSRAKRRPAPTPAAARTAAKRSPAASPGQALGQ